MTVQELIEQLKTMPSDVEVIGDYCSDYASIAKVYLVTKESEAIVKGNAQDSYWDYSIHHWTGPTPLAASGRKPEFVTVVKIGF